MEAVVEAVEEVEAMVALCSRSHCNHSNKNSTQGEVAGWTLAWLQAVAAAATRG